jgi:hypothetical protein
VGTQVYLKLQPYVQQFVQLRFNLKLIYKYFGLFQVLERIGKVAYRLQLPEHSLIHHVVHVSQFKLADEFQGTANSSLPSDVLQYRVPVQVVASRTINYGGSLVAQVKVKWFESTDDSVTWEDYEVLK